MEERPIYWIFVSLIDDALRLNIDRHVLFCFSMWTNWVKYQRMIGSSGSEPRQDVESFRWLGFSCEVDRMQWIRGRQKIKLLFVCQAHMMPISSMSVRRSPRLDEHAGKCKSSRSGSCDSTKMISIEIKLNRSTVIRAELGFQVTGSSRCENLSLSETRLDLVSAPTVHIYAYSWDR